MKKETYRTIIRTDEKENKESIIEEAFAGLMDALTEKYLFIQMPNYNKLKETFKNRLKLDNRTFNSQEDAERYLKAEYPASPSASCLFRKNGNIYRLVRNQITISD